MILKHKGNPPLPRQKPMMAGRQPILKVYRKRNQLVPELPLLVRPKLKVRNRKRRHHVLNSKRHLPRRLRHRRFKDMLPYRTQKPLDDRPHRMQRVTARPKLPKLRAVVPPHPPQIVRNPLPPLKRLPFVRRPQRHLRQKKLPLQL